MTPELAALAGHLAEGLAALAAEVRVDLVVDEPKVRVPTIAPRPGGDAAVAEPGGRDADNRLAAWLTDGAVTLLGARSAAAVSATANGHAAPALVAVPQPVPGDRAPARSRTLPAAGRQRAPRHASHRRGPVTPEAAEAHFETALAHGRVPSLRQVKEQMNVGTDRARELREHLKAVAARR